MLPAYFRKRRPLRLPITLTAVLMSLNIALMVCWIVLLTQLNSWSVLTIGTVFFALILAGLIVYLVVTIKEVRLNQRQVNFVDSVTHELKSPIASLRLYLETLQMRPLEGQQRSEFYEVMETELERLDHLINQLLEVGRLDAIGRKVDLEEVELEPLLQRCARIACARHKRSENEVVCFDIEPAVVLGRELPLEMIFGNLLDNAIKYTEDDPTVEVQVRIRDDGRVVTRITDNGVGIPAEMHKKVFRMFDRGGDELQRKQQGTGLGLYIVRTLVHILKGEVSIHDRVEKPGTVFEIELPGRALA